MSYKIAIFETQNDAIQALQALERAGFANTELTVIAKDREHSRRIESETDVHADELQDLTDTRSAVDQHGLSDPRIIAPIAASPGVGMTGTFTSGMAYPGTSFVTAAAFLDDDNSMNSALSDLGVPSGDLDACRDAIANGAIIVAAETGSGQSNGGPDLTRGGAAEAAFRTSGAARIL
jgi:Heat induced stress protein YflT domain